MWEIQAGIVDVLKNMCIPDFSFNPSSNGEQSWICSGWLFATINFGLFVHVLYIYTCIYMCCILKIIYIYIHIYLYIIGINTSCCQPSIPGLFFRKNYRFGPSWFQHLSNAKRARSLGYTGDGILHPVMWGLYRKPLYRSLVNNQDSMEIQSFFSWLIWIV